MSSKSCEPPVPAVPPAFNIVATLEVLIGNAPTRVERILCGFFCCLAYSCLRCSDLLTTRNLHITKDSIAGQSLMKTSKVWTQWYAPRIGVSGSDWASEWMQQLCLAKLPGKDYIITGFNGKLDRWLPRRASYKDIAQAFQAILVTVASIPYEIAGVLTPHSFRHFLVGPGRQLQIQGVVTVEGMESLGHWERGSSMPALYDAQSGVTELSARSTIVSALAKGWSPAKNGEIASKYSTESVIESVATSYKISNWATDLCKSHKRRSCDLIKGLLVVAHTKRKRLHYVSVSSTHTLCRWWECGSESSPGKCAVFGDPSSDVLVDYVWCRHCIR